MFHVKHEPWPAVRGVALSDGQVAQLRAFERLLSDRAVPAGLISAGDATKLGERHIADSLRGVPLVPADARSLCDLGSGAGLPGIPLAVACAEVEVTLSERRRSRRAFLEYVCEALELTNVSVTGRFEELGAGFDVCVARAFADAATAWEAAQRLLTEGGKLLYWAGRRSFSASRLPVGVSIEAIGPPLAREGPVVIMGRT